MGLDSPSPPSIPTSHVTKVPVQKESTDKPNSVQEGTLGLDNQKRAHAQVSPLAPIASALLLGDLQSCSLPSAAASWLL